MTTLEAAADSVHARAGERLAQWTRALCVLFFFSGFPALIYQLTWQRALFRIFGVNIESVTVVVTAFMLGLGIGSLAGGWLSKHGRDCAVAAACDHRARDRRLRSRVARDLRPGGRFRARPLAADDRRRHLGAGHRADPADGRHVARAGRPSGAPLGQCRRLGRAALLRQHARRRRRVPRLRGAVVPVSRHARCDLRGGRHERRGRGGRARDASTRSRRGLVRELFAGRLRADAGARLGSRAGAGRRRRLRVALLRDLLLPHRVLCVGLERHRLRRDAERVPGRDRVGVAPGRRELPALLARRSDAPRGARPDESQPARPPACCRSSVISPGSTAA